MLVSDYPTESIHLPTQPLSIRLTRVVSIVGGVFVALSTCAIFLAWLLRIDFLSSFFGRTLINLPIVIALIICSITIFFYSFIKQPFLVILGVIIFCIGFVTVLIYFYNSLSIFSGFSAMNLRAGVIFVLL